MRQSCCITFAGPVGTSKTPIAYYLSWNSGLPVLSNDIIRVEVEEDLGAFDQSEYERRRDERLKALIASGKSFIYDASVDRQWLKLKDWLGDYQTFIISLDLSQAKIEQLYKAKGYTETQLIPQLYQQHQDFLKEHGQEVNLHITDESFADRLELSLKAVLAAIV